ncbi:SDR family NAD(P)-dependent oxidoreductase [Streptomyces sp. Ru62]|uniref:SDR family NAD(P)-dependent oxidoreductase n=1 Tax=Streptomyces sp. Ru62 TaxID=2080745 RepID=UPI0021561124|nr:SDR family NAD(P)-dependent oxidoreductase [Streptomyces sp. Ru62]
MGARRLAGLELGRVGRRTAVAAAVRRTAETFGRLDVVVNNAGYGLFGMVEETTEEQARAQLDTNLFGPLWVTQAALPYLRAQGSGHILQVSSLGGLAAFPTRGLYNAAKWALEGMSEALAQEIAPFGIHVTLIEPGPYGTDWSGTSAVHTEPLPAYEPVRAARRAGASARTPQDARGTAAVVLDLVDTGTPPLRLFLGTYPYPVVEAAYRKRARHVERLAAPRVPCVTGTEHPAAPGGGRAPGASGALPPGSHVTSDTPG